MKKIALFVAALAVSLSLGGRALADTNTATLSDKAGITPDNTILYPIDRAIDNLKISITFDTDKKAKVLVEVAEERLGESEVMSEKSKTDFANQALKEYNEKITEAQDKVEDAIDNSSNSATKTDSTTGSAINTDSDIKLDELEKLEKAITDRQMKSIEVLKNIESKVSGNAKETIAQVIEMQTRKKEAIVAVAKERQTLLQAKKAVKEAEKKVEQAKKAGDSQAIKTAGDALAQAQLTLTTENKKFSQVVAAKKEAMKGGVGQLKKQAKQDQTKDATSSTSANTSTETTPAINNGTATTNQSIVNNNTTATNNTNTDVTVKENKGQEIKATKKNNVKENKGQDTKADKENNSANENKSKH